MRYDRLGDYHRFQDESCFHRTCCAGRLDVSDPRCYAGRDCCSPSPARCSATQRTASSGPEAVRSRAMDTVVVALARLAALAAHLEAGHGRPLASERVRPLLDLEVPPSSGKTTFGLSHSRLDSTNVPSQLLVGSTAHSRRVTQTGHRGCPVNGGQISAPTPESAFADLADLPEEPHEADGLDGLLHCANGNPPGAVRLHRVIARPPAHRALQRHRTPN